MKVSYHLILWFSIQILWMKHLSRQIDGVKRFRFFTFWRLDAPCGEPIPLDFDSGIEAAQFVESPL